MISYFPSLHEDELVYSLFARYYQKTGYTTYRDVASDLFQNPAVRTDIEFINQLTDDAFNHIQRMKPIEQVILENTMYSYYGRFMEKGRRQNAYTSLVQMTGNHMNLLIMKKSKGKDRYLRYCPLCSKLDIFEKVLTNPFDNDQFVGFVREFLNNVELVAPTKYNKEYSNFSFYVDGYYHIGNYKSEDGDKIAVFSVCLNKGDTVERARSMQRNFVKTLIEKGGCAGAIVAFYTKEEPAKWRLSFIRMDYEFSKGKVTEKLTPAKRYSYLVGKGEPCHTAKQRLYPIFMDDNNNPGIDDLEEAFSVEKVTNEFFDLYKEKYIELKEYLESNEDFMSEANYRHFTSEQFAKKLMGQIVFLYFIQKKGWLGVDAFPIVMTEKQYKNAYFARGTKSREIVPKVYAPQADGTYRIVFSELQALSDEDEEFLAGIVKGKPWGSGPKDFMRRMFDGCVEAGKNYFDDYLEPLFYTGLNKNRGENGFYAPLHRRIPFLNGGLFEQLDNYEWENNNFNIPNELFSNKAEKGRDADGILDIFDRYNFTMNEDEPMEREVAIDP